MWEEAHERALRTLEGGRVSDCEEREIVRGEGLANRVLLGTAGRDPKIELTEQTKGP